MPRTRTPDPDPRRERVPIGIFLPDPHRSRTSSHRGRRLAPWHDLRPWDLAHLIATYTRAGDVVINADAHPTVDLATRYLRRHPATTTGDPIKARISADPAARRAYHRHRGAGLVLATPPNPTTSDTPDPSWPLEALTAWRRTLRPGGFLVLAPPTHLDTPPGGGVSGLVIAAARTAGLVYQQHLLVVTQPLTEDEPPTTPGVRVALHAGRHARTHRDLLTFTTTTVREGRADA